MEHSEMFDFVDIAFLDKWSPTIVVRRGLLIKRQTHNVTHTKLIGFRRPWFWLQCDTHISNGPWLILIIVTSRPKGHRCFTSRQQCTGCDTLIGNEPWLILVTSRPKCDTNTDVLRHDKNVQYRVRHTCSTVMVVILIKLRRDIFFLDHDLLIILHGKNLTHTEMFDQLRRDFVAVGPHGRVFAPVDYVYTTLQHTATHCNALQHTATHCNTLQNTATHCKTLQRGTHRDVWPTSSWFCCSWVPWAYLSTNWLFIWTKWNQLSFIAFWIYVHQIHRACHQWFTPILHCIWPHQTRLQNNKGRVLCIFKKTPTKFTKSTEWTACFTTRCVLQKVQKKSAFSSFSWINLHIQSTLSFPPLLMFTFIYIYMKFSKCVFQTVTKQWSFSPFSWNNLYIQCTFHFHHFSKLNGWCIHIFNIFFSFVSHFSDYCDRPTNSKFTYAIASPVTISRETSESIGVPMKESFHPPVLVVVTHAKESFLTYVRVTSHILKIISHESNHFSRKWESSCIVKDDSSWKRSNSHVCKAVMSYIK